MGKTIDTLASGDTFDKRVRLRSGGLDTEVRFTFHRLTTPQIHDFAARLETMTDEAALEEILAGWGLDDELGPESIARLCEQVPGAALAITRACIDAHYGRA